MHMIGVLCIIMSAINIPFSWSLLGSDNIKKLN